MRYQEDPPMNGPGVEGAKAVTTKVSIRNYWIGKMRPFVKPMDTQVYVAGPVMNANLKYMRSFGLDDDDIKAKIDLFADEVRTKSIRVTGSPAWFVFMRRWQSLKVKGGSTSYSNTIDVASSWDKL